jgi:CheY-like chemotaxis protein
VLGFTELIDHDAENPDKVKEYVSKIRFSGEYLMNLINNVLEVARIDSGKETVDESFMDLLSRGYLVIFENDLQKKNLTMNVNADVTHRYVLTDAHKVREIYMNLVSNAIKYTPDGGTITLDVIEYPCEKPGYATYVASVADTGIGMTREFQEHIFELFSRERNSTESKVMGTGLGTSIIKKLVDLMGGTVTVESEPGKGSKFTVTFDFLIATEPEKYLEKAAREAENIEHFDLSGRRILLAEDNELNAEIAVALLSNLGAEVETACDGIQCMDMLQSHDAGYYDLILMDIQMPNMNGYDTAKKIRALSDSGKSSIPIIAMTANAFTEDRDAAFAAGMNGHIGKPIDVRKLEAELKAAFS